MVKADAGGELKAHEELTAKYDVQWRKLHDSCWECLGVGGLKPAAPAEQAAEEEDWDAV